MYKRILVSREEIKKTRTERETSMKESGGEGRERKKKGKEKNGNVAVGKINLASGGRWFPQIFL